MYECTEERFLSDTKDHAMKVVSDDGLHRQITFSRNESSVYRFDLITWPGHLCITGDCGTYVFSRVPDMFEFFRMDDNDWNKNRDGGLSINPRYWGEKLLSIGTNAGYREFDEERFKERVTEYFNSWKECEEPTDSRAAELWKEIEDHVLSRADDGEIYAYQAAHDFDHEGFYFQDFFDSGGTERYTFHYIWCLYAIAWGIEQYDSAKAKAA